MNRRFCYLLAIALVIAANLFVLLGVRFNRSGPPDADLLVTERELPIAWRSVAVQEDSSLALQLEVQDLHSSQWQDCDKLISLGFDCPPPQGESRRGYRRQPSRRAYTVLEYEGTAWQRFQEETKKKTTEVELELSRQPEQREELERRIIALRAEAANSSRLFAVDLGPDPDILRSRYPDRSRYAIVPSEVRLYQYSASPPYSVLQHLLVDRVLVPRDLRHVIEDLHGNGFLRRPSGEDPPRYRVALRFGQRHEPWIVDLRPMAESPPSEPSP